ncbi:MAG: hypothetical protein ABR600_05145 [Actinomycetota bacterium]
MKRIRGAATLACAGLVCAVAITGQARAEGGTRVTSSFVSAGMRSFDALHPLHVVTPQRLPTGEHVIGVRRPGSENGAPLGEWTEVPRTWPVPPSGGGMAYDAARDEVVSFGGCCFQGDTWVFGHGAWTKADPGALAPSARASNVMAYDPIRRNIVMFGGSQYGETWTWDGTSWQVYAQPGGPQFRSDAAMAWMPRIGSVVLFGGYPDVSPDHLGGQLADTWAWDGASWRRIVTAHSPPARYAAGLALDPGSGDLILFGGLSDTYESLADTWRFDGTDWSRVETAVTPERRSYVSMASDPAVGAIELFGGYALEKGYVALADRWWFVDGRWTQDIPGVESGPLPPARFGGGLAYDVSTDSMVLFGGTCDPTCGGVWAENLEAVRLPDGTVERRLIWTETPMSWPADRMSAGSMVPDPMGRGDLMHGGFGDSTGMAPPTDTWIWDGDWHRIDTDGAPPGRQALSIAANPASGTAVLTGGLVGYNTLDPSAWVFDGSRWQAHTPDPSPPGRYQAAMAEDRNGNDVLFGGYTLPSGTRLGDTWIWDGGRWTQSAGPGPSARAYPQMAYDPVRKETVLFGGNDGNGTTSSETWVWNGTAWTMKSPAVSPPGKIGAAMAWDPVSRQIVMIGGATCVNLACTVTNEVWTWDGSTWSRAPSLSGPSARWFPVAGSTSQGIVLFGGQSGGSDLPYSDTWLWRSAA